MSGNSFKNKELARKAGQKSKRKPNAKILAIRNLILDKAKDNKAIEKAFTELKTLKGKEYIQSLINLLSIVIPKGIDLTNDGDSFDFNISNDELINGLNEFIELAKKRKA